MISHCLSIRFYYFTVRKKIISGFMRILYVMLYSCGMKWRREGSMKV